MDLEVKYRPAVAGDLVSVSALLAHLGYPAGEAKLTGTFLAFLQDPGAEAVMAETAQGNPAGFMSLRRYHALRLSGLCVTIEELVVHPEYRGRRIGSRLLELAVRKATAMGAMRLEVCTSLTRESYRRKFYEKNGLERAPSGLYRKELS